MNWFKENKFLTGYIAAMVVGVGVFGYLLFAAKGSYDEASDKYEHQASELSRLQHLQPYPNTANLEKVADQKKDHATKVEELRKTVVGMKLAQEPLSPEQFQDKLRASVTAFNQKAADKGTKIPDKFYLGFDTYATVPPKPEVAPFLGRELKVIENVLNDIINSNATELNSVKPDDMIEEKGGGKKSGGGTQGGQGTNQKGQKSVASRHSFEIVFTGYNRAAQSVINEITSDHDQFLIPRLVIVKNEKEQGPSKEAPAPATPAPTPTAGGAGSDATPGPPPIIVGNETVQVTLLVEMVDFPDPSAKPPVASK